MLEFKSDTQLLIEYFITHFKGDCLLAVEDD